MLKQALNELEIQLRLQAVSPLLIKDGRYDQAQREDWGPDKVRRKIMPMAVPISRNTEYELQRAVTDPDPVAAVSKLDFFLPATSLRGAWRSHLERTLRGLDPGDRPRVCDPLAVGQREPGQGEDEDIVVSATDASCSNVLGLQAKRHNEAQEKIAAEQRTEYHPYAYSCPVCRLFGSTVQASRLSISDGERVMGTGRILVREHVRINRRTGQVAGAPLKFFALQDSAFDVTVRLRNFELWQVALTGLLLEQVRAALIPVGSGKNKGYGQLGARISKVTLTSFGIRKPDERLRGIAEHALAAADLAGAYRLQHIDREVPLPPGQWDSPAVPWRHERMIAPEHFERIWRPLLPLQWDFPPLANRLEYTL